MRPILRIASAIVVFATTMNGTLLFGLTTAFLFAMISEVWDTVSRAQTREAERGGSRTLLEEHGGL
jgi:hypothetical protein